MYIAIINVKKSAVNISCQINTDFSVMFQRSVSTHATVTEVTTCTWIVSCSLYGLYLHSGYLLMLA